MKTSRHFVYAESRDTEDQPIMQGPFTAAQFRAFEAQVEHRKYHASVGRFRDLLTNEVGERLDEATIEAEVEESCRRRTWVVDGVMYGTDEEVGHFCPGYYDCLRCYAD